VSDWLIRKAQIEATLPPASEAMRYAASLRHGTMRLGYYAPRGDDIQTPHRQDELYVVVAGSGAFVREGEREPFGPGDTIFVPANVEHRFEDFTTDFAAWVIFWGPDGGEG
jgi:mannose-6-phosphate isomerase-like protein (cupin superfamily)